MYARDRFMQELADLLEEAYDLGFSDIDLQENILVVDLPDGDTFEITVVEQPF